MNLKSQTGKWIIISFLCGVLTVLAVSWIFGGKESTIVKSAQEITYWTCSMHPQIKLPDPGKCPICGMTLIPLKKGKSEEESDVTLTLSETAKQLAKIQTAPVEMKFVETTIRMVGKVDFDETRLFYITAWVAGRIDRLFIDYTGIFVKKGDHMAQLYSPELLSAQEEYLQAIQSIQDVKESHLAVIRETSESTLVNSREKLKLLGISEEQIKEIEQRRTASDHMTIYAPTGGVVISKEVKAGAYVKTGARIYTIADLSKVWIKLDAYETDIKWLRYGQKVELETESYPGDIFEGMISFIDPVLDEKTRTIKIRVNVDNKEGKMKPGMFVRASVRVKTSASGVVVDPALSTKWICPMHPEVISDSEGVCSICGMKLESLKNLGYISVNDVKDEMPLVIPVSAALLTGKRAIVYVALTDKKEPTYVGREVVLGSKAGDYYIVKKGLQEGEQVVVNGNFKIDSALQIQAKPSMMSVKEEKEETNKKTSETYTVSMEFLKTIEPLYNAYFALQAALAGDDLESAKKALSAIKMSLSDVNMSLLKNHESHMAWVAFDKKIRASLEHMAHVKTLKEIRNMIFIDLSAVIVSLREQFGSSGTTDFEMFCPMADGGKGAVWLQNNDELKNPYYGTAMSGCGDLKQTFPLMETDKQAGMTMMKEGVHHEGSHH